jgi:diguanylate cyclase (GGDEF)-like protein
MQKKVFFAFSIIIVAGIFLSFPSIFAENIKLKALAVNPSSEKQQEVTIKFDLPKEVAPENIVDIGDFNLRYNFEKSNYYVHQIVDLGPSEKRLLEVVIKDIWIISENELMILRGHSEKLAGILSDGEYKETGKEMFSNIDKQIESIVSKQSDPTVSTKEHMDIYYENKVVLDEIKYNIGILERLVIGSGKLLEEKYGSEFATGAISISEESFGEEDGIGERLSTVAVNIETENPSEEEKTTSVKYSFPQEVNPRDIIDRGNLDVGYDFDTETYYAYDEDVVLAPGEKRKYTVTIRDIWLIPEEKLYIMLTHAQKMRKMVEGTMFFEKASELYGATKVGVEAIIEAQNEGIVERVGVSDHIGIYRDNTKRLEEIEAFIIELEKIVADIGGKPGITVIAKREGLGTKDITGQAQKFPGERGLKIIAETIFRGKVPSLATTWKIIYSILGFLALVSGLFFIVQYSERRKGMIDPLTGVFSREYIMERFKEELRIASKTKNKCSLIMMDIDEYKKINDIYGHIVGDIVLKEFVIALRKGVRATDLVGRFGGDEFIIVFPTMNKDLAEKTAQNLRKIIEDYKIAIQDKVLSVTSSIGVVTFPDDSFTMEDLFNKADIAMYQAKDRGGNNVVAFSSSSEDAPPSMFSSEEV